MTKIRRLMLGVALAVGAILVPSARAGEPLTVRLFGQDFIVPLQVVNGTELYSFKEGKGFPAAETVLWERRTWQVGAGAASVIGTDANVPFAFVQKRLSDRVFDTSNNDLRFGAWVGKPSRRIGEAEMPRWLWGIKASVPLW